MARFEVEIPGSMYCMWPSGEEIALMDCCFIAGNADREFIVQTEVYAESQDEARRVGRDKCQDATNLLELCMEERLDLNELQDNVREEGSTTTVGSLSVGLSANLVSNEPITKEQLEAAAKAQNAIQAEQDPEKKEALFRAIHWQALARRETKSKIDRFIKFWIALEVLVEGKGKDLVEKVNKQLKKLYADCPDAKLKDVVGHIYGIRADIVHFGVREPHKVEEKLKQLEDILSDLLRQRLGLEFKTLAKKHFE